MGLMGGSAYANSIHVFNHSPRISAEKRDRLVNYAFALSMVCMLSSTGLGMVLDNTVLTYNEIRKNCPVAAVVN